MLRYGMSLYGKGYLNVLITDSKAAACERLPREL